MWSIFIWYICWCVKTLMGAVGRNVKLLSPAVQENSEGLLCGVHLCRPRTPWVGKWKDKDLQVHPWALGRAAAPPTTTGEREDKVLLLLTVFLFACLLVLFCFFLHTHTHTHKLQDCKNCPSFRGCILAVGSCLEVCRVFGLQTCSVRVLPLQNPDTISSVGSEPHFSWL